MKINLIYDEEKELFGETIITIEMDFIPRVGETFTLMPTDDRQLFKVTHVDYTIEENKLIEVDVWVF